MFSGTRAPFGFNSTSSGLGNVGASARNAINVDALPVPINPATVANGASGLENTFFATLVHDLEVAFIFLLGSKLIAESPFMRR